MKTTSIGLGLLSESHSDIRGRLPARRPDARPTNPKTEKTRRSLSVWY